MHPVCTVTQDRECRGNLDNQDILVRECQDMVAMNKGEALVVLPTEVDTLLDTQPAHNRTFHRVTPASLACPGLATLRPLAIPATTDSHSQHLKEVTPPTTACLVLQVHSMQACLLTQEYHSQASPLDHLVHRVSLGLQTNRKECLKVQDSLMLREAHTYQCLLGVQECLIWVQECQGCHQEDQECLQEDLECHQEVQEDLVCHLEDQECLPEDLVCHQMVHL